MPTVTGTAVGALAISNATALATVTVFGVASGTIRFSIAQVGEPLGAVARANLLPSTYVANLLR